MGDWFILFDTKSSMGIVDPGTQAVLIASFQASVLAMMVLGIQLVMGRWLSPRWRYALWSVVVIRLMMPIAPASVFSVFNLFQGEPGSNVIVVPLPPMTTPNMAYHPDMGTYTMTSMSWPETGTGWGVVDIVCFVWLAGVAVILLAIIAINVALTLRLRRRSAITDPGLLELVEACKREMGVRREVVLYDDPKTTSPALAGIFRPSLLIPPNLLADLPQQELRFILLHELAHVKKHDIAQNWLLIALSAVHWFNPVIWFAFARLRADRELARDAMVLNTTGTDANQAYGQTIIHTLERITHPHLHNPALAGIGDGLGQLKRRLRMIALAPKRRPALTFIGITLLATLAVIGLTDAAEPEAPNNTEQIVEVVTNDEAGNDGVSDPSPRRVNMRNLLNLGLAIQVYAANNEDRLPPDLGATLTYVDRSSEWAQEDQRPATPREKARLYLTPQDQKNTEIPEEPTPEWINENTSYIYLGGEDVTLPAIPQDVRAATVILHEKLDAGHPHPKAGNQIAVVWSDGHVEAISINQAEQVIAESKKTLEDARQAVANPKRNFRVDFDLTPLEDAIEQVRNKIDVPLFVNWKTLEAAGVDRAEPIKMTVITTSSDMLVLTIFRAVSDGKGLDAPAVEMIDGVLNVSTRRDLRMPSDTRVYDIRHLLRAADPDSKPTPLAPRADGTIPERPAKKRPSREELVGQIADLIRETVGYYEEWEAHGGDLSSVSELAGNLIVNTSQANHEKIPALLAKLGEKRSVQIRFELKFLLVPERFAEETGLGLEQTPEGNRIAFLDDLEAGLVTQAVRKNPSAKTLAAPQVLQLNGKKFSVTVASQVSYVAGYNHVEGVDGIKYEPLPDTYTEGLTFEGKGAASADMRSVKLSLHPTVTNVAHPLEKKLWKDSPPDQDLFIEVPEVTKAEKEITLSIPDQGTVLIDVGTVSGPMDKHDPVEEGVERRVYMLVKPTIIIQPANENTVP